MTKAYLIKLKNGDEIKITEDQFKQISSALTKGKPNIPAFIEVDENLIKTDYIATIKKESW